MIQELNVHNFVLIKDISISFADGFNVLTGETGAGKSLMVDAINFLGGKRTNSQVVGPHDSKMYVEALFTQLPTNLEIIFEEIGLDYPEDDCLVIVREMHESGKGSVKINGRITPVSNLKIIINSLLDIHSQNETKYLLDDKYHQQFLDDYIDSSICLSEYQNVYHEYKSILTAIQNLKQNELDPDMLEYSKQLFQELESFNPSIEDYDRVKETLTIMEEQEKSKETIQSLKTQFKGEGKTLESLYDIKNMMESKDIFNKYVDRINSLYYELEDLSEEIFNRFPTSTYNEKEYDSLSERLFNYTRYIKKYISIEGVVQKKADLEEYIHRIEHYDDLLAQHEHDLEKIKLKLEEAAHKLSDYRLKNKYKLEETIVDVLKKLQLENASFDINITPGEYTKNGNDSISFFVSMNKGMELASLTKVASGGELSRFMLALKIVFSKDMQGMTLILDEIDTGVSGKIGMMIGEQMKVLGNDIQVISITHLASVAAYAKTHYTITKETNQDETITQVEELDYNKRIEELAYIMSGMIDDTSKEAAAKLLETGQK